MSWTSFEETLNAAGPGLREATQAIVTVLRDAQTPNGVDPIVIARRAGVDEVRTLAALQVLRIAGLGGWVIQVVNDRGQAIQEFESIAAIREPVMDEYGKTVPVEPRNTRVVFRPAFA